MGVFGAGIFGDDEALDVRSDYKYFLADAQSDALATEAIARDYGASFDDPQHTTGFWLGLALTQWKIGRLDPRVKAIALRIVDEGLDLKKWEGSPDRGKRAKALAQARAQILAEQPEAKPLPKPLPLQLPGWEPGEIAGVRLPNGRLAVLHMIRYLKSSGYGVKAPVITVFNWTGVEPPNSEELEKLTYINWRRTTRGNFQYCLASPKRSPIPAERFIRFGVFKPLLPGEEKSPYAGISRGRSLEDLLTEILEPYWENPSLPPHHPGFDKPEAALFKQPHR